MLTLATLYALTGLAWLWWTGRLDNAEREWARDPPGVGKRLAALCVVLAIWPVAVVRGAR